MKKLIYAPILLLALMINSCIPAEKQQGDYVMAEFLLYDLDCEYEVYNKDGELLRTYVGESRSRTDYNYADRDQVNFTKDGNTYRLEWEEIGEFNSENGYLVLTLGGVRVQQLESFEYYKYSTHSGGRVTEVNIKGANVSEPPPLFPQGVQFEIEGSSTCMHITDYKKDTYWETGTLYSTVVDYSCNEETIISVQLYYDLGFPQ